MQTSLNTDFTRRKVTNADINADINEYRKTKNLNYFKNDEKRMELIRDSGALLYYGVHDINDKEGTPYKLAAWTFEVPNLMRFFYPDYKYCVAVGFLLLCYVLVEREKKEKEELENNETQNLESNQEPV